MIYTVTVNPSVDYIIHLLHLKIGKINRMQYSTILPGGKGINVSRILNELNCSNVAWGFLGGFTGNFIENELIKLNLNTDFVSIKEETRLNVKIKGQTETEINGQGPHITFQELNDFKAKFSALTTNDIVIFAGSLLPDLKENFYFELIKIIKQKKAQFVIDTTGESLLKTLSQHPLVVKPNNYELAAMFNVKLKNMTDIVKYGKKLLKMGAQNVLISMAAKGGLMITPHKIYHSLAPQGIVVNSVGAGDSMLAGFVGKYTQTHDILEAFRYGIACGSATAFTEDLANYHQIMKLVSQIKITEY